jgi:dTDP-4-dehydrorhamnose 3,5-epimerase
MPFIETGLPDLLVYEPLVFEDSRGFFYESYNQKIFGGAGVETQFVQDNQSRSTYGVIRGLHYQVPPYAQAKLVRALVGTILDVVVDVRKGSPTFGKVYSIELSAQNKKQLFVPAGFAHGFSVLSDVAEVMYKCDQFYHKGSEQGILYNDPALKIDWKVPIDKAIVSDKDKILPVFANCVNPFEFKG